MLSILNALIPVILIILLGILLKRGSLFSEAQWQGVENLCYFVLFPSLLVKTLATAEVGGADILLFSGMILFAIFAMSGLLIIAFPLLNRRFGVDAGAFTSLFQGATRWHGFIALSIAGFLLGDEAIAYMAITMAVIIPPLNVINITVLALYCGKSANFGDVGRKIITNPFIIACLIGAFLNLTGIGLSSTLYATLDLLGGGALGLGLLAVGAGLQFRKVLDHRFLVIFGTLIRLLGMPLLMFAGAWIFGIDGMPRTVAVLAGAVPTAGSSYVLARQMGGDASLMANLITVQVVVSVITLPIMIWWAGG
ncbi:MAG: AEC family transporter [Candidatus Sedimenticola sp. (ex Thyasira tokunagai)]